MKIAHSGSTLICLCASALVALAVVAPSAQAEEGFLWDGAFTGLGLDTVARAINDNSQIAGSSGGFAAVWDSGSMSLLDSTGYASSLALSINATGQVAGFGKTTHDLIKPVLWSGGVRQELPTLGGAQGMATAVNNSGVAAGFSMTTAGVMNASLWNSGVVSSLGFPADLASQAFGLNNAGQVVGVVNRRGFVWDNGVVTDLGVNVYPQAINDSGQVVGYRFTLSNKPEAFSWDSANGMRRLSFMDGLWSKAYAINNSGQIVGFSQEIFPGDYLASSSIVTHAILWQGATVNDLGTLYGTYSIAYGINAQGRVVGVVPEPAGAIALLVGLTGLAGAFLRRSRLP
ncbi:MAG: DUF3466 family protein [Armatimonadetes bacterium]|nr:DUF3466 family protein [Armatimonadota bacterium]